MDFGQPNAAISSTDHDLSMFTELCQWETKIKVNVSLD